MNITLYADGGTYKNRTCVCDANKDEYTVVQWDEKRTNNQLEYLALKQAVEYWYSAYGEGNLTIYMDSQLICNQILGVYKVRNHLLKPFYRKAKLSMKAANLPEEIVHWIPRKENLAGIHLDQIKDQEVYKRI